VIAAHEGAPRLERILSGRGRDQPPARPTRSPKRFNRLADDEVTELVRLRQHGAEINDLAARFELSRSAVMANLERAGVPGAAVARAHIVTRQTQGCRRALRKRAEL
jgi:hypothetical protein